MHLLPIIRTYFEADARLDAAAFVECFAPDAVVKDEGQTRTGHQAIRTWWTDAKAKYRHTSEPFETSERGNVTQVRARVTGDFAGSPAVLTYAFRVAGGKIAALEIGA